MTPTYREQLLSVVRRRSRALGLPFSLWTGQQLADPSPSAPASAGEAAGCSESVYRLLRASGSHLRWPQHTITSPDPEYALKKTGD